jgi:hypothetical protein
VRVAQAQLVSMAQIHSLPEKWLPVSIVPSDGDLEVCVIENGEVYALVFPCHRNGDAWVDALTKKRIDIQPTHWRLWVNDR